MLAVTPSWHSVSNVESLTLTCGIQTKTNRRNDVYLFDILCVCADALITAIRNDIEEANQKLELPEHQKLKEDNFFKDPLDTPVDKTSTSTAASTLSTESKHIMNGH